MDSVIYKIVCVPDITLTKNKIGSTGGLNGLLSLHNSFLRIWNRKGLISDISLHLFYEYIPYEDSDSGNIRCYIMLRSENKICEDSVRLFESHPLIKKYEIRKLEELEFIDELACEYKKCSVLMKNEVFTQDTVENSVQTRYTIPEWETDDAARLYEMFTVMDAVRHHAVYRVDLYPVNYEIELRDTIQSIKAVSEKNNSSQDFFNSRNRTNEKVISSYEKIAEKIEKSPHYIMNIFCFADSEDDSQIILDAAGADAISEGSYKVVTFDGQYDALYFLRDNNVSALKSTEDIKNHMTHIIQKNNYGWKVCRDIAREYRLNYLPVLFTLEEVEPFFRLPAIDDGEQIQMRMDSDFVPKNGQDTIAIGCDTRGLKLDYPIELLNKHAFICGVPGSGKTYTMLHLVTELHKKDIPFLVMEPAKKEYRAIYNYGGEMMDIMLFSPHMNSRFPLQVNLLEFPKGITLCEHINVLMNVFTSTFELGDAVYSLLDEAISQAYEAKGWKEFDENDGTKSYPCLSEVCDFYTKLVETTSYDGEIKGNIKSFLTTRLGGLMRRDAGEVFNVTSSSIKPEEWIRNSCIIEMEDMGEKNRNFLTLLLCNYIREELKVIKRENTSDSKRPNHVIFIEEAHNIISNTTEQGGENINPKISATKFIVDMLAEVRALRESIIIADQLPSSMAEEVMKNTGLKIALRMTSKDERQYIGSTMSASPVQLDDLSRFEKGKSLVFFESLEKSMNIQVSKWEGNDNPLDDLELSKMMYLSDISDYRNDIEKRNIRMQEELDETITRYQKYTEMLNVEKPSLRIMKERDKCGNKMEKIIYEKALMNEDKKYYEE